MAGGPNRRRRGGGQQVCVSFGGCPQAACVSGRTNGTPSHPARKYARSAIDGPARMWSSSASSDVRHLDWVPPAVVCAGSWSSSHVKLPRDPGSQLQVRFQTPLAHIIRFAGWRPVASRERLPRRRTRPSALAPCSGAIWHLGPVAAAASGYGESVRTGAWGGGWATSVMTWVVFTLCCVTMSLGRIGPDARRRRHVPRTGALLGGLLTLLVLVVLLGVAGGAGVWEGRENPSVAQPLFSPLPLVCSEIRAVRSASQGQARGPFDPTCGFPGEGPSGFTVAAINVTSLLGKRHVVIDRFDDLGASVVLMQETKHDDKDMSQVNLAFRPRGWRTIWGPSGPKNRSAASGGVAIAGPEGSLSPLLAAGRPVPGTRRWLAAVVHASASGLDGPLLVLTVYGHPNGDRSSRSLHDTAAVIEEAIAATAGWHSHWVIGGDVNTDPAHCPGLAAMVLHGSAVDFGALGDSLEPTFVQGGRQSRLSTVWGSRSLLPYWSRSQVIDAGFANHRVVAARFRAASPRSSPCWFLPKGRPTPVVALPEPAEDDEPMDPAVWRAERAEARWAWWEEYCWEAT